MSPKTTIVFVMGPTCSGKSTFLQTAQLKFEEECGLVEVGKMMREKYPPDYFKGQSAPSHTTEEAWQMCESAVKYYRGKGKRVILVDGQPRDVEQTHRTLDASRFSPHEFVVLFLLLDAPLEDRERRLMESDRTEADKQTLGVPRLTNDMISNYTVLTELLRHGAQFGFVDTTNPDNVLKPEELFDPILHNIHRLTCEHGGWVA